MIGILSRTKEMGRVKPNKRAIIFSLKTNVSPYMFNFRKTLYEFIKV
ncbi:MAG: hypothetical protein IKB66_03730 [Clostridia bacterium]|nr:hypothetical protein [Clostridia bacterium]